MSYSNISAALSATDKQAILQAIQDIKTKLPFLVSLTPGERQKLRKMGATRTSYVQDVYNTAASNSAVIPPTFSLPEFGKDTALNQDLLDILMVLAPLSEGVDDTLKALGTELVHQADECYGYLKVASKKNANQNLKELVKRISDQLKQGPQKAPGNGSAASK